MSISARRLQKAGRGGEVLVSVLAQQNTGTWSGTSVTVTLPSTPASTSCLILFVAGNTTLSTPSGWTLRESQVNYMGHYCYTRTGTTQSSWTVSTAAGQGTWWLGEVTNAAYDASASANATAFDTTYTTPLIVPTTGTRMLLASIGSLSSTGVRTASGWTNSFNEVADICQATADNPMQGVATRTVTSNGSASYSTAATLSATSNGRSAIICSLVTSASGGGSDVTPPSVPTGLVATAAGSTAVNLTWTASTDNIGVDHYIIYRGGTQVGIAAGTSYSDTGLSPSTSYTYTVRAVDTSSNQSTLSQTASATTSGTGGAQKVAVIGDSLTYQDGGGQGNVPATMESVGWPSGGTWFYGVVGKAINDPDSNGKTTVQTIADCRAAIGEPDVWVIALGTNDALTYASPSKISTDIQAVLTALGSSARVVWVNVGGDPARDLNTLAVDVNAGILSAVNARPKTLLADWQNFIIPNNQASYWLDRTHMYPNGYDVRNMFVARLARDAQYMQYTVSGWPDATNTGWQHTGITLTTVTPGMSGSGWYTDVVGGNNMFYVNQNGAVVDGLDIQGFGVKVMANNVTMKRCRIRNGGYYSVFVGDLPTEYHHFTMEDVELDGMNDPANPTVAVNATANATFRRCNIYGMGSTAARIGTANLFEDNYFHDYNQLPGEHLAGTSTNAGETGVVIRHNTIKIAASGASSTLAFYRDFGNPSNILVLQNNLHGGNYTIMTGVRDSGGTYPAINDMRFHGNTIGREYYADGGLLGPVAQFSYANGSGNLWSGNTWGGGAAATGAHATGSLVIP